MSGKNVWTVERGGGALGPIRNRKTGQNFHQNRKTGRKTAQNRKNAENNDQHCKFVIFNPSALDTTAKILALGTIQCPCYTACSANLMCIFPKKIFAMFNQRNRFFHCLRLIWRWNFCNSWWTQKGQYNALICSQEPNNRNPNQIILTVTRAPFSKVPVTFRARSYILKSKSILKRCRSF